MGKMTVRVRAPSRRGMSAMRAEVTRTCRGRLWQRAVGAKGVTIGRLDLYHSESGDQPMNARSLSNFRTAVIVATFAFAIGGCSMLQTSDKAVLEQAQGFDQGIKPAEI